MKKASLLLAASCGALLLSGCEYDDGYATGSVSVSSGGYSPYYGDGYDEYSPYYSYSGRRYYRSGGRYLYYSNSRPVYVSVLPSGARYITPQRHHSQVTSSDRYRHQQVVTKYEPQRRNDDYQRRNDDYQRYNNDDRRRNDDDQRERPKAHASFTPPQRQESHARAPLILPHQDASKRKDEGRSKTQQAESRRKPEPQTQPKGQQHSKDEKKDKKEKKDD